MALLRHEATGQTLVLRARHLLGRSPVADTVLQTVGVSGEHAVLTWVGEGWELRDLGSRNGTFVGNRRLGSGERIRLAAGQAIAFGNPGDPWLLDSVAAPAVVAVSGRRVVEGDGDFLALPSFEDPVVVTERDLQGWFSVRDDERSPLADRDTLVIGDEAWQISLPQAQAVTAPLSGQTGVQQLLQRALGSVRLELAVSGDEEYVEAVVRVDGERRPLPPKAHHYLLLVLARARLEDAAGGVSSSEQGWLYSSDLRTMLRCSANQFYVMCHRCRREFEGLDIPDATDVIERRTTSRQVRLGIGDLAVRAL